MGFRFYKRVGGNEGWGLNFSGSGLSSSYRSKYGSFSSKGFSIRTGIPGLSFRTGWGGGRKSGSAALIFLAIMGSLFLIYLALVVLYNLGRWLIWAGSEVYRLVMRTYYRYKEKQALKIEAQSAENNLNEN